MGGTYHWFGFMGNDRSDWRVEAGRGVPPFELDDSADEGAAFTAATRDLVMGADVPAFAAYVYDDDFAYLCVGADGEVRGELLFDRHAAEIFGVRIDPERLEAGPRNISGWAKDHAPMWAGPGVVDALARDGGRGDSLRQLMRVFGIELPYAD
jgi:hypothetical protein